MSLRVKLLSKDAKVPTRGSEHAAGLDLYSIDDTSINPGNRVLVHTGISVSVPHGYYGRVAPRSGLALKHGIDTLAGVIDSDYRGEVGVVLINHGHSNFKIFPGERVAQLIIEKIETPDIEVVNELDDTERGENGYGSTGRNWI